MTTYCPNCGQTNTAESNFCRACGNRLGFQPPPTPQPQRSANATDYEYSPPSPYSWKTDEFQTARPEKKQTEPINRVQPLGNFNHAPNQTFSAPVPYQQQQTMAHGYRCPRCGTNAPPMIERKVSTAGWIVFSILLVFTWIFFWIGLLMKENVRICPVCNAKVG